jgi:hypothetical protein
VTIDATWVDFYYNTTTPPYAELGSFEIVTTSSMGTASFSYDESGILVADNGLGLPMPEPTEYVPSFDIVVNGMPTGWTTYDAGMGDIRYGCEYPMVFEPGTGGGGDA